MRVEFVGVGEAFDESLPNNSQIVEWRGGRILIDCGYAVPHALWKRHPDPNYLDAIYVSHRHADHYFGLPSYLYRLEEDRRESPIRIFCPDGMKQVILEMMDYAYLGIFSNLSFHPTIEEMSTEKTFSFQNALLEFAVSSHPVKNFAIAIYADGKKYAYSGDGNFNTHTRELYRNCSLLVHEAYSLDGGVNGHAKMSEVLEMAKEQRVQKLALTHISRADRKNRRPEMDSFIRNSGLDVIIPEPGDIHEI